MGEGAKKKCAAEARAAKKAKMAKATPESLALTDSEAPAAGAFTDPTTSDVPTQSNAGNSKQTGTAPRVVPSRVNVRSVPTRQSTRSSTQLTTLGSVTGKNHASASLKFQGIDNGKTHPKRSATARAMALLQELQFSETEDIEDDPDGVFTGNEEVDMITELDEDEDEDDDGSDTGVEVIQEPAVARKGLPKPKVPAVRKKPNLQAIDKEGSSDESGE